MKKKRLLLITGVILSLHLVSCGDRTEGNTFLKNVSKKNISAIKKQLTQGEDINQQATKSGYTGLHIATNKGDKKMIKFLLENKADPNIKDNKGQTVIFLLLKTFYDKGEILQLLIDAGADINLKNADANTLWEYILENEHTKKQIEILEILAENNCIIDTLTDKTGKNVLHKVAEIYDTDKLVKILVEKRNFNVNAVDINGWTALHFAISQDNYETTKALLEAGAAINQKTTKLVGTWVGTKEKGHYLHPYPEGSTPLDIDSKTGHTRLSKGIKKLLIENGGKYSEELNH